MFADISDGVGNVNTFQAAAVKKSIFANAGDGIGDNSFFTTCYQLIAGRLDNGFAIVAGIIGRVVACHNNARQAGAVKVSVTYCISINLD